MTGNREMNPNEGPMPVRELNIDARGGQDHSLALYAAAYDGGGRMPGQANMMNYRGDDPQYFRGGQIGYGQDGTIEIPRCFPLPTPDGNFHFPEQDPKPTDKQQTEAEQKVDGKINGLIPDADQQNLKDANQALLTGDSKALAAVYEKYQDDPTKLKAFVEEQNRELKDSNSGVGVQIDGDGKVVVSKDYGKRGVEIDPATGKATVRQIMHGPNGEVYIGDQVANADPDKALERVGNHAVDEITEPKFSWMQHEHWKGHFKRSFRLGLDVQQEPEDGAPPVAGPMYNAQAVAV